MCVISTLLRSYKIWTNCVFCRRVFYIGNVIVWLSQLVSGKSFSSYELVIKTDQLAANIWEDIGRHMERLSWSLIFALFSAYHSEAMPPTVTSDMLLNYEDIVRLTGDKSIILIDVRQPNELKETGVLPTSINIPLNDLKTALESLPSEEFEKTYGIPLPDKDAPLVFTCRSGNRSMKALLTALELGYKNSKHYTGGYLDWEKYQGPSQ